jgi:sialate O-acetylesterase
MVIQRDRPIHIWGTAAPAEPVSVRLQARTCATTSDALGRWDCFLRPIPAGGPFDLTVAATNTVTLHDILAGEVWVASGQSNMVLQMSREAHVKEEAPKARFPKIRFFNVAAKVSETRLADVQGEWKLVTPETVSAFSAVSYYFARDLHQKLGVPFGIIVSAVGGTPAEAWTSGLALTSDPLLLPSLVNWQQTLTAFPDAQRRFEIQSKAAPKSAAAPVLQEPPGPGHRFSPSGLYNGMISPLTPLSIRGVLWSQGENNANRDTSDQYTRLFETLIRDWRRAWDQGDFPFLYVQLPPFAPNGKPRELWPEVQEAQLRTLELRNTGMVVTLDVGTLDNIHPPNKLVPGGRMALAARAIAYGENIEYSGPVYRQTAREGSTLRLWFDHIASGLEAHGGTLEGFTIAGAQGDFVPAEAHIDGMSIIVSSPKVRQPTAVRYAWGGDKTGNLYNSAGLPAPPFRTKR